MYHKIEVLLLPSKTETNCVIGKFVDTNQLIVRNENDIPRGVPHHLYLISDEEEIKKGDWIYDVCDGIVKVEHEYQLSNMMVFRKDCKKIITTTDTFLRLTEIVKEDDSTEFPYITSLPQPSQSFIEYFVKEYNKGNVITEVEVEYEQEFCLNCEWNYDSCPNIEGCLSIYKLKVNSDNTINIKEINSYLTPKEKAYELFNNFLPILGEIEKKDWVYFHGEHAKQCALITVQELIKESCKHSECKDPHHQEGRIDFWSKVKQEIEKL